MSNPPATMLWRRERFTISTEGTANMRVHSAEGKSVLEVSSSPPVAAKLGLGSREKKCVWRFNNNSVSVVYQTGAKEMEFFVMNWIFFFEGKKNN